jgi:hypothetical protein
MIELIPLHSAAEAAMSRTRQAIIGEIRRREPLNISPVKRSRPKMIQQVHVVWPFRDCKRALLESIAQPSRIR